MASGRGKSLLDYLRTVPDLRRQQGWRYPLVGLLALLTSWRPCTGRVLCAGCGNGRRRIRNYCSNRWTRHEIWVVASLALGE